MLPRPVRTNCRESPGIGKLHPGEHQSVALTETPTDVHPQYWTRRTGVTGYLILKTLLLLATNNSTIPAG